jgi:hypothetical protein
VYLGYVIGGGELKIDLTKSEDILKWLVPNNVIDVRIFVDIVQYLWKFIESFLVVFSPLHAITISGKFLVGKESIEGFQ